MKTVYTCFCTDVIHEGHLNIIKEAQKYGKVIIGVLSDEALIRFNKFPTISFQERFELMQTIDGVYKIVEQKDLFYDDIVKKYKPDYIIHGDNWKTGPLQVIRNNVISLLNTQYSGGGKKD